MTALIRPFGTTPTGEAIDAIRLQSGELTAVVLTLGAGDVWKVGEDLLRRRHGESATQI